MRCDQSLTLNKEEMQYVKYFHNRFIKRTRQTPTLTVPRQFSFLFNLFFFNFQISLRETDESLLQHLTWVSLSPSSLPLLLMLHIR